MNDKELAKKVAEYLGWNGQESKNPYPAKWFECPNGDKVLSSQLETTVFSWPVTGMMIEEMERLDWVMIKDFSGAMFTYRPLRPIGKKQDGPQFHKAIRTGYYSPRQHGYHKAIAKAFVEACEIIDSNDRGRG